MEEKIDLVKYYGRIAITLLIVMGLGLFLINQFLAYHYRAEFLAGPCQLCVKLNPEVGSCWAIKEYVAATPRIINLSEPIQLFANTLNSSSAR